MRPMPQHPRSSRRRAFLALAAACLLPLSACGGGGGAAGTLPPRALTPGEAQAAAQEILTGCVESSLDEALAVMALIQPLLDTEGAALPPEVMLGGVSIVSGRLTATWTADLDSDEVFESSGTASLGGVSLLQLAALAAAFNTPDADIAGLLSQLPNGAVLSLGFNVNRIFTTSGTIDVGVSNDGSGAVPSLSSGSVETAQPDCSVTYSWQDVLVSDILVAESLYPDADVAIDVTSTEGNMNGTVMFDGTSSALIDTIVDPGEVHTLFTLDLTTGAVTPAAP